ncbi:MAG: hypothetical protein LBG13_01660 [Holosporales bacterium]|jgi:F0F1-type ATP synthase epsilon subunit|nr:hypothetical protein [Holosporales bacterium]
MSNAAIKCVLFFNNGKIFEDDVFEIVVHTGNGDVTILHGHIPYISRIDSYVSLTKTDSQKETIDISDGFVYTNGDICFVVAE